MSASAAGVNARRLSVSPSTSGRAARVLPLAPLVLTVGRRGRVGPGLRTPPGAHTGVSLRARQAKHHAAVDLAGAHLVKHLVYVIERALGNGRVDQPAGVEIESLDHVLARPHD